MTQRTEPLSANEIGRRRALARFGLDLPAASPAPATSREWAKLVPDFAVSRDIGTLEKLPPALRLMAEEHVLQRREVDRLMLECDAMHARIAAEGAVPELVEAYAKVRDEFEDAVERFAAHREELARRLNAS